MAWTSEPGVAYVWVWLPEHTDPVPAGILAKAGKEYRFRYGTSYLDRPDAMSLYPPELPLRPGWQEPREGLTMPGSVWDASPDGWGQRIIADLLGRPGSTHEELGKLTMLLESGSNRIGALDFQTSASEYRERGEHATLEELHAAAEALQTGTLNPELRRALVGGTLVGGARPKAALIDDAGRQWIAKFSISTDPYPVVKAEALAMELARRAGIRVPHTRLTHSLGREVLLVERFDRLPGGYRRHMVSGLTMLGYDTLLGARYSSYPDMLDVLRQNSIGTDPGQELFERIVLNIAVGNDDDHARNHSAFWDGRSLDLTPAYDIAPGNGASTRQAMDIGRNGERESNWKTCLDAAGIYGLSRPAASDVIARIETVIRKDFDDAADIAELTSAERANLWGLQFLNDRVGRTS